MEAGAGVGGRLRRGPLAAWVAAASLLAVLIGAGVGIGVRQLRGARTVPPAAVVRHHGLDGEATWAEGARPAPMINTLPDQTGRLFSLASLRGRNVALVFFDSHCHQECPLEGRALAAAERRLPAAQRPVLVAVSVDPADTPASAARAVSRWGLAAAAPWHWLMGTRRQLAPVWAEYHIYVSAHPIHGDIQHTEALFLIDRRGYERSAYLWPFAPRLVTHDLRTLATGRGA